MLGLIPYIVAALVIAASSAYVTHRFDKSAYLELQANYAAAQAKAVTAAHRAELRVQEVMIDAAIKEAAAQQKIVVRRVTTVKEVPIYVKDTSACITYGLVRVLDAAALGVRPAELPAAAGQPDGACAPVKPSDLAASVVENYGAASQNAEQLTALQNVIRAMISTWSSAAVSSR